MENKKEKRKINKSKKKEKRTRKGEGEGEVTSNTSCFARTLLTRRRNTAGC